MHGLWSGRFLRAVWPVRWGVLVTTTVPPFYANSYLTVQEYKESPTALDARTLVPDRPGTTQDEQLAGLIQQASRFLDNMARQELYASVQTQSDDVRVNRQGFAVLHAQQDRATQVTGFAWGMSPTSLTALSTVTPTQYLIQDNRILFSLSPAGNLSWVGGLNVGMPVNTRNLYVRWSYIAGWCTTVLSGAAAVGATSVTVADPSGLYPGAAVRVAQGSQAEQVTVAGSWVYGQATVPLTAPLTYGYDQGSGVSNVPDDIRRATVMATSAYIKARKSGGFVLGGVSGTVDQTTDQQVGSDLAQAREIAQRYALKAS